MYPCCRLSRKSRQLEHNRGYGFSVDGGKGWLQSYVAGPKYAGWLPSGAIRKAAGPEKTDSLAKGLPGSGSTKVLTASRVATVHVSTLVALSQEPVARA